jgi:plastocyanin
MGEEVLEPTRIENTTDPEICGNQHTLEDLRISPANRGIQHAILSVRNVPETAIFPHAPGRLVLDNVGCRFSPHAAVMVAGGTLETLNSDSILHTTHLYGPEEWNASLPARGVRNQRRLERSGLYAVRCDVHGWMQATIRVDPHPFHAVTDESGAFRIEGLPEGRYELDAWHERLGSRETEVDVKPGAAARVVLEYSLNP